MFIAPPAADCWGGPAFEKLLEHVLLFLTRKKRVCYLYLEHVLISADLLFYERD